MLTLSLSLLEYSVVLLITAEALTLLLLLLLLLAVLILTIHSVLSHATIEPGVIQFLECKVNRVITHRIMGLTVKRMSSAR